METYKAGIGGQVKVVKAASTACGLRADRVRDMAPEPIQASSALDGGLGCIAEARRRAAAFLTHAQQEYGVPVSARALDLTQLVVSELVTNACKYAPGPILMDLRVTGALVEVSVWDSDHVLPVARAAEPGRVGQHGLEIVLAVAEAFEAQREPVGKRITVRIALADGPAAVR